MMVSSERSKQCSTQFTVPCHDCPMRRESMAGWLGGATPQEYRLLAHSDAIVDCHAYRWKNRSGRPQCAGMAIYRKNVVKRIDAPGLVLPGDTKTVFATPFEFLEHHEWRNKR